MSYFLSKVHRHEHYEDRVSDCIANVVQESTEVASDVQLGRQHSIQIIHDVVVYDQRKQELVSVLAKENTDRNYAKNRYDVGQIPENDVLTVLFF